MSNTTVLQFRRLADRAARAIRAATTEPDAPTLTPRASAWSSPRAERSAKALVLAGAAALPLQSTATVDVGFTLRASHVLFAAALLPGLPYALRGFLRLPPWLRWSAVGLFATYVVVTATSDLATIAGTPRGGGMRAAVYLADLLLGIATMCLVRGLWHGLRALQPLVIAMTFGAGVAALYALWQWPAQHYGLPLADILTTRDSNGITSGGSQGTGLFGWERVRGTFLEPHFLGAFMSAAVPVGVIAAAQARGTVRRMAYAATTAMLAALLLSSSAPAWAGSAIAVIGGCAAWTIGAGRPRPAAVAAAAAAIAVLAAPALVAAPEVLTSVTGRDPTTLTATATFRKQTWDRVLDIWAARPAEGYGAGQSSVRLTLATEGPSAVGLQSAQGLWGASLLDVGLIGLGFWLALLGTALMLVLRTTWSQPSLVDAALAAAMIAALCSTLVANDRLDLRVWVLVGVAAAASVRRSLGLRR